MIFQNYHRHSYYTNTKIPDSCISNEDYAKRAKELNHGIISTCEHGYQGRYIEGYELSKKYDLKFVFGVEAYWVKDRIEKDRSNCHIYIAARNENGRQSINDILAEANITGYYYQPRIDLDLIFSLPKDDIIITSACIAFWKYEDIEDIILKLSEYFGKNFFLEAQYHNTESQKNINNRIINLSNKYNIPIIMGCDSHYIHEATAWERDDFIKSKKIFYEEESGWFMDYPDGETAKQRFIEQGILTNAQIDEAINNTNIFLEVEEYDNPCFNFEIKMPTLYPNNTQEEKDKIFVDLIRKLWLEERIKIPKEKWKVYQDEIKKEIDVIIETKHADYFLLDYEIVKQGIKDGGIITNTGRGSAPSMYINKLLGFTDVDRISASVKMFPERFMSATRILEAKTLADLDLNLGTPEIFAKAQKKIFGEEHSYPMVAYGTMQPKSAWKMYARSQDVSAEMSDLMSKQIDKYDRAIKYAPDDETRDEINVLDYINEQYHDTFSKSEKYLGIIDNIKPHPCAHLIYQGNIRKEIGLIMIKAKQSKKEVLCCCMDGLWAENQKFLKNDLLKVLVIENIKKIYARIGIDVHSVSDLLSICTPDNKVWDIYKKSITIGINQVEQPGSSSRVAKYNPKNISELCAFIAAIRPGFKSMYKTFENRENFSYGIKSLDDLIQTEEFPQSFILYQEIQMMVLAYAGIPMTECYEIIKNIAKKRVEKVLKYKNIFIENFTKLMIDKENKTEEEAKKLSDKIWQILEDSSRYSFNASHSYCVAIDSLYGAYLKSHYPIYFYEVFLNILESKGEKDRMVKTKEEAENYFNINFPKMMFRQDNRNIVADIENNCITNSIQSIKGFSKSLAEQLYLMKDLNFDTFIDFLIYIEENYTLSTKIGDLIKLQYFQEFGNNKKLITLYDEFKEGKNRYNKKLSEKSKITRIENLKEMEKILPNENLKLDEQLQIEMELLGYISCKYDNVSPRYAYVLNVDEKFAPRIECYFLNSGKIKSLKVYKKDFNKVPITVGNIIDCKITHDKPVQKYVDGVYVEDISQYNTWLTSYSIKR